MNRKIVIVFQTVDTDFSPGDWSFESMLGASATGFRPLTRISLLVTRHSAPSPIGITPRFQTVDTDFSPGDMSVSIELFIQQYGFRPLTRISLLVTSVAMDIRVATAAGFRPLTRISLLVTHRSQFTPYRIIVYVSDR